jgi:hypothetical protein
MQVAQWERMNGWMDGEIKYVKVRTLEGLVRFKDVQEIVPRELTHGLIVGERLPAGVFRATRKIITPQNSAPRVAINRLIAGVTAFVKSINRSKFKTIQCYLVSTCLNSFKSLSVLTTVAK